jgi:multicomponent Na+:H+ antiporter subunit F
MASWVVFGSGALLAIGAVLALIRVQRGPSILDRMVGLDIIASVLAIGVALEAAWSRRTETLPVLAALALVGFVSSVAVARFVAVEPEDAGKMKSAEEVRAEEEERVRQEEEEARLEAEIAASREEDG